MHKSATKCNETLSKWCKNKHGASKIMDTFETYQGADYPAKNGNIRLNNPPENWTARIKSLVEF
jgi:hypothetical protein